MAKSLDEQLKQIKKGATEVIPDREVRDKLESARDEDRPLRVKLGVDPSSPDLTLGHAVVLRKLRQLQDLGHTAVLVVGDFTRRIGDPTGRSETRSIMSHEEIEENMADYEKQAFRILDPERTEFKFNSEWLGKLTFEDIIDLTSKYTVARMLERDDFSTRYSNNQPISILEFIYPLAQAYDSVAVDSDIELGGTDQKFNLLIGRHIQREFGQDPQIILTMPLLEGTDGEMAMSQTRGNYIGISESPVEVYGKVMSLADKLMPKYFRLLTPYEEEEFSDLHPKQRKKKLAYEIVAFVYSAIEAEHAQQEFENVYEKGEKPSEMKQLSLTPDQLKDNGTIWILDLVDQSGFVSSRSEARRLINQGGVRVKDEQVEGLDNDVEIDGEFVLQVGKTNYAKVSLIQD